MSNLRGGFFFVSHEWYGVWSRNFLAYWYYMNYGWWFFLKNIKRSSRYIFYTVFKFSYTSLVCFGSFSWLAWQLDCNNLINLIVVWLIHNEHNCARTLTNEHDCAALTSMDFLLEFLESHKFAELTIETNAHQHARKQNLYAWTLFWKDESLRMNSNSLVFSMITVIVKNGMTPINEIQRLLFYFYFFISSS